MLNEKDCKFLDQRKTLVSKWNVAAVLMLIVLAGTLIWLFVKAPALVNLAYVIDAVKTGEFTSCTLLFSALLLPIVVLFIFLTFAIFILYGCAITANEKRYLEIIEQMKDSRQGAEAYSSQLPESH